MSHDLFYSFVFKLTVVMLGYFDKDSDILVACVIAEVKKEKKKKQLVQREMLLRAGCVVVGMITLQTSSAHDEFCCVVSANCLETTLQLYSDRLTYI